MQVVFTKGKPSPLGYSAPMLVDNICHSAPRQNKSAVLTAVLCLGIEIVHVTEMPLALLMRRGLHGACSSGLVRSKAECSSEEADLAVRTLLDILLQSRVCQASQV